MREAESQRALAAARQRGDEAAIVSALADLSVWYVHRGLIQAAHSSLHSCFDHVGATRDAALIATVWRHAATLEMLMRRLEPARDMLSEALSWHAHAEAPEGEVATRLLRACVLMVLGGGLSSEAQSEVETADRLAAAHPSRCASRDLYRLSVGWIVRTLQGVDAGDGRAQIASFVEAPQRHRAMTSLAISMGWS